MEREKTYLLLLLMAVCCHAGCISCRNNVKKQEVSMNATSPYNDKAERLVAGLKRKGITDERVLAAIGKTPRHLFVDENLAAFAYDDKPLPIDKGQTISQPYTVAFQTELLRLTPGEKVLEIGTGSGYQAAVLCEMEADVYSIERHYPLYVKAQETLRQSGYHPLLFYGDGYEGLPEHAPFDKILVTAATERIPDKLLGQLRIGGLMVVPVGDDIRQKMTVVERLGVNKFRKSEHGDFLFVPMVKGME